MRQSIKDIGAWEPDNLIAGNTHPQDNRAVNLASGTGILKRGSLINQYGSICNSVTDVPVGILCDDVELNEDKQTESLMYITGDFRTSEIITGENVEAINFEIALRELGIFLK